MNVSNIYYEYRVKYIIKLFCYLLWQSFCHRGLYSQTLLSTKQNSLNYAWWWICFAKLQSLKDNTQLDNLKFCCLKTFCNCGRKVQTTSEIKPRSFAFISYFLSSNSTLFQTGKKPWYIVYLLANVNKSLRSNNPSISEKTMRVTWLDKHLHLQRLSTVRDWQKKITI